MSTTWIEALAQLQAARTSAVLVTVIEEQGSTPRSAGAKMVVSHDALFGSIGGGHLEYKATEIARQRLEEGVTQPHLERFALGASLGQCCGGAVTLLFETIAAECIHIALFGAGHVGRALVPVLAGLPCRIRWVDSRDDAYPDQVPKGVETICNEFPEDEVDAMPPGSYFVVMTHSHQLDLKLSERILQRGDFGYYGLIGSKTKRKKFEHRLHAKGFTSEQIARITCPVGLAEIPGKRPAEIAVSIAGQMIAHYHAAATEQQSPPAKSTAPLSEGQAPKGQATP